MNPFTKVLTLLIVLSLFLTTLPGVVNAAPVTQTPVDTMPLAAPVTAADLTDGATGELVTAAGVLPSTLYD